MVAVVVAAAGEVAAEEVVPAVACLAPCWLFRVELGEVAGPLQETQLLAQIFAKHFRHPLSYSLRGSRERQCEFC